MEGRPEAPKYSEKSWSRARAVVEMIHDGRAKNVPEAVRQVLRNEQITHEPDIKRIMVELGPVITKMESVIADEQDFLHSEGEFAPDFDKAAQKREEKE